MTKEESGKRREAIVNHWMNTNNMAETGRIFKISRERVRQIVKAERIKSESI